MYFHIGMRVYLWSDNIVGIFDVAVLPDLTCQQAAWEDCATTLNVTIIDHGLQDADVKTCVLTRKNELHLSNVNVRTLRKRWKRRKQHAITTTS